MFCGECGASVGSQDRVCPACGAKLHSESHPSASVAALKRPGFGIIAITRGVLNALSEGRVIRRSIAIALQIAAVLVLLAALWVLVLILKQSFQSGTTAGTTIGGILAALLLSAALFAVSQIYLFRANSVRDLEDSPFTVIPIVSILFRAAGETYAVIGIAFGIGGCLFTLLSNDASPGTLLQGFGAALGPFAPFLSGWGAGGNGPFLDGVIFLASMAVTAFISLVGMYAAAEMVVVIVDIAINVRKIENREMGSASATGR